MSSLGGLEPQPQHPWLSPAIGFPTHVTRTVGSALTKEIQNRLYMYPIKFQNPHAKHFWSPEYFDRLMTPSTVEKLVKHLLKRMYLPIAWRGRIWTCQDWQLLINGHPQEQKLGYSRASGYRRVLALLMMVNKCARIHDFIRLGLTDAKLPLHPQHEVFQSQRSWNHPDITLFCEAYQWRLTVPYFFKERRPRRVCELELQPNDIKPWEVLRTITPPTNPQPRPTMQLPRINLHSNRYGGFGEVRKVVIHPTQHEYRDILAQWSAENNIFALKRLFTGNKEEFDKEAEMLKRFGGIHPHIICLLATVVCLENGIPHFHLLFPWADTDLLRLWKLQPAGIHGVYRVSWLAEQCYEIVKAVNSIHNPNPRIFIDGVEKWGRHGDIKPQNVLCFIEPGSRKIKFVLSDLGLAQARGDATRSNIPGEGLPGTPNYRPPECDMAPHQGGNLGYVSRSYDIWTLGCLFLELTVWALQGWDGAERFASDRCSVTYLDMGGNDSYYGLERINGQMGRFSLKTPVFERLDSLHQHPRCTGFFRDLLELVQRHMLCVRSDERIKGPHLQEKMRGLCTSRPATYYETPCPHRNWIQHGGSVEAILSNKLRRGA